MINQRSIYAHRMANPQRIQVGFEGVSEEDRSRVCGEEFEDVRLNFGSSGRRCRKGFWSDARPSNEESFKYSMFEI